MAVQPIICTMKEQHPLINRVLCLCISIQFPSSTKYRRAMIHLRLQPLNPSTQTESRATSSTNQSASATNKKGKKGTRRAEGGGPTHQVVVVGELGHGGALAAGDDERVDAEELLRLAHLHPLHPDPPQRCTHPHTPVKSTTRASAIWWAAEGDEIGFRTGHVLVVGALQREDAHHRHCPPPDPAPPTSRRAFRWVGRSEREARRLVERSGW